MKTRIEAHKPTQLLPLGFHLGLGLLSAIVFFSLAPHVLAAPGSLAQTPWYQRLLADRFPGARIELEDPQNLLASQPCTTQNAQMISEGPQGYFRVRCGQTFDQVFRMKAWTQAAIATRRIHTGERLSNDQFKVMEVDVSFGQFRPYREAMLNLTTQDLQQFQSSQTIIEGSPILSAAIKKIPDVKRGDGVRLQVKSGEIYFSLQGVAAEDGRLGDPLRVYTEKSRRELVGKLTSVGTVEVSL